MSPLLSERLEQVLYSGWRPCERAGWQLQSTVKLRTRTQMDARVAYCMQTSQRQTNCTLLDVELKVRRIDMRESLMGDATG